MRAVFLVLAMTILLCLTSPAADRPIRPMTEVLRMQGNLFESQRLIEQLQATWGDDCGVPELLEMWNQLCAGEPPQSGWQGVVQFSLARTGPCFLTQSIILPQGGRFKESLAVLDTTEYISSSGYVGVLMGFTNDDDHVTPAEYTKTYGAN